jgi:hypothetical protein
VIHHPAAALFEACSREKQRARNLLAGVEAKFFGAFFGQPSISDCLFFKSSSKLDIAFLRGHLLKFDCLFEILSEHFS